MSILHPDLRRGRFIPPFTFGPRALRLVQAVTARPPVRAVPTGSAVVRTVHQVPGPLGSGPVALRLFQPAGLSDPAPALLWVHGGGLIMGHPAQDDRTNIAFVRELGITVAAVSYRLAPGHRAPAAIEDAYAGLSGLLAHAEEWRVDPGRVALGGTSAGGGLAAALAQLTHDRGEVRPAFQFLVYPMLDDRTALRAELDTLGVRLWTRRSNHYGWTSYLGTEPGGETVPPYAVPARREDLAGLPPAWVGVGTLDLFHDEDVAYAERLRAAGVPCTLVEVPGAFHGFDVAFARAGVSQQFWRDQVDALRGALFDGVSPDC